MIDYIKAARRLRRLLSTLRDQDPELYKVAEILERLGLSRKSEHPVKQAFREAGKILRDLEVSPGFEAFVRELLGEEKPSAPQSAAQPTIEAERDRLKEEVAKLTARNINLESDKAARDYQIEALNKEVAALRKHEKELTAMPTSTQELLEDIRLYCTAVIDPSSTSAAERVVMFKALLKRVT